MLAMTLGSPPSITDTTELVVPRSIPTIFDMRLVSWAAPRATTRPRREAPPQSNGVPCARYVQALGCKQVRDRRRDFVAVNLAAMWRGTAVSLALPSDL